MTNRPFSALLFSTAQHQTNAKDLLSPCSGTQASAQAGMYLPRYFLFSYCYRLCCLRGKKPWLRSLWSRLGESESVFLYTDLKFSLLSGSQHVFMRGGTERCSAPDGGPCLEGQPREPGRRKSCTAWQTARPDTLTEPRRWLCQVLQHF